MHPVPGLRGSERGGNRERRLNNTDKPLKQAGSRYFVAVDMGASHVRFVLVDTQANILQEIEETLKSEGGTQGVVAQIQEGVQRVATGMGTLQGIAIGVPGGVDPRTGLVFDVTNVPGWREVDMGGALEDAFHVPVFLDNDANMAAIGEHWRGIARDVENFVFVALGTGVGAGIFMDGRICRGRSGLAGEIFRMNLDWNRWNETFSDSGYFEAHVSGMGLAMLGRKALPDGNGTVRSLQEERDARYLFAALRDGDARARTLIENSFTVLGVGIANLVSVLDPQLIVFNGGVVRGAPELLLETVGKVVCRIHPRSPRIELSTLGEKAQIWGAIHTLLEPSSQPASRTSKRALSS
jgi:glucokinase